MAEDVGVRSGRYQIGDWTFCVEADELRRGETKRRLEHRASRALELLCRRRGDIVSQEELVAEVWYGRSVSPNSVPVVISDLRQALDDDAREPRHIETVAKRGYRLLTGEKPAPADRLAAVRGRRRLSAAILLVLILIVLAILIFAQNTRYGQTSVVMMDVVNATGQPRLDALASATSEVVLANLSNLEDVEITRGEGGSSGDALTLTARLVMWSGRPTVMLSATDSEGAVIWTGMTSGAEKRIPRDVHRAIGEFAAVLKPAPPR